MSVIYITEDGSEVGVNSNQVVVKNKSGEVRNIPVETIEGITIIGNKMLLGFNRYGKQKTQLFLELKDVSKIEEQYINIINERNNIFNRVRTKREEEQSKRIRVILIATIVILLVLLRAKMILKKL